MIKLIDFINDDYRNLDVYSSFSETCYLDANMYKYPVKYVKRKAELTDYGMKLYSDILSLNVELDTEAKCAVVYMSKHKRCGLVLMDYRNNKVFELLNLIQLQLPATEHTKQLIMPLETWQ